MSHKVKIYEFAHRSIKEYKQKALMEAIIDKFIKDRDFRESVLFHKVTQGQEKILYCETADIEKFQNTFGNKFHNKEIFTAMIEVYLKDK